MKKSSSDFVDAPAALEWIRSEIARLTASGTTLNQAMAKSIGDIIDLYNPNNNPSNYNSIVLGNVKLIEATSTLASLRAGQISAILFALLKYDLPSLADTNLSKDVQERLTKSLLCLLDMPENSLDINRIKSYKSFDSFKADVGKVGRNFSGRTRKSIEQGSEVPLLDDKIKEVENLPPDDYDGRAAALTSINAAIRSVLAAELAPALNARLRSMPQETLEDKKELARFVNAGLEPLGLAVKEPRTGRPGKLRGMASGRAKNGSFQIEVKIDGKQEYPTTVAELPILELMDGSPHEKAASDFRELVKHSKLPRETQR